MPSVPLTRSVCASTIPKGLAVRVARAVGAVVRRVACLLAKVADRPGASIGIVPLLAIGIAGTTYRPRSACGYSRGTGTYSVWVVTLNIARLAATEAGPRARSIRGVRGGYSRGLRIAFAVRRRTGIALGILNTRPTGHGFLCN